MLDSVKHSYRPLCSTKKLIQALVLFDRLSTAARIRDAREASYARTPLLEGPYAPLTDRVTLRPELPPFCQFH